MITFTVYGTPKPQGSMRGFAYFDRKTNKYRAAITSDNAQLKPWRQQITLCAIEAMKSFNLPILGREVGVKIFLEFWLAKPKSTKRAQPTVKPDTDKLIRGVLDGLTGVCFEDDAQVVRIEAVKQYGAPERMLVTVGAE